MSDSRELEVTAGTWSNNDLAAETRSYSANEAILYALSIGVGLRGATEVDELKYLREPGLQTLPTFVTALPSVAIAAVTKSFAKEDDGVILHRSQKLTMYAPVPAFGTVEILRRIERATSPPRTVARVHNEVRMRGEKNLLATIESEVVRRPREVVRAPHRSPAFTVQRPTPTLVVDLPSARNQALLYRLLGDLNPIHVDTPIAYAAGFSSPILQGLVSYGMVGRALIKALCADTPARMLDLSTRFTDAIFPGEALRLEVWIAERGLATFRLVATDRGVIVHDLGRFRFSE